MLCCTFHFLTFAFKDNCCRGKVRTAAAWEEMCLVRNESIYYSCWQSHLYIKKKKKRLPSFPSNHCLSFFFRLCSLRSAFLERKQRFAADALKQLVSQLQSAADALSPRKVIKTVVKTFLLSLIKNFFLPLSLTIIKRKCMFNAMCLEPCGPHSDNRDIFPLIIVFPNMSWHEFYTINHQLLPN